MPRLVTSDLCTLLELNHPLHRYLIPLKLLCLVSRAQMTPSWAEVVDDRKMGFLLGSNGGKVRGK